MQASWNPSCVSASAFLACTKQLNGICGWLWESSNTNKLQVNKNVDYKKMNSKSTVHLQRAVDLLERYQRRKRFGGPNDDVVILDGPAEPFDPAAHKRKKTEDHKDKIKKARKFVEWLSEKSNDEYTNKSDRDIQYDFDRYLMMNDVVNLDPEDPEADKVDQALVNYRRDTSRLLSLLSSDFGLFVHENDAVFRELRLSNKLIEHVRQAEKVLFIFDGVLAGASDRRNPQFYFIEYDSKKELTESLHGTIQNFYTTEIKNNGRMISRLQKISWGRSHDSIPKGPELTEIVERHLKNIIPRSANPIFSVKDVMKVQTHGLFVHPADPIFKNLRVTYSFNESIKANEHVFLVVDGKSAGYNTTVGKNTWWIIRYPSKEDLQDALAPSIIDSDLFKNFYKTQIQPCMQKNAQCKPWVHVMKWGDPGKKHEDLGPYIEERFQEVLQKLK